jgi:uncharacterized protein YjbI with pentapeptide repeats
MMSRSALRDIIRYWTAVLSVVDLDEPLWITLDEYSGEQRPPKAISAREFNRAVREGFEVSDRVVEGAELSDLELDALKLEDVRVEGGAWKNVVCHGPSPAWTRTGFVSVTFDAVVADAVSARHSFFEHVDMRHCQFENQANFEWALFRTTFTATGGSFQTATFRRSMFVPNRDAEKPDKRKTFPVHTEQAPIRFVGVNLSGARFDRAILCGVSFAGCDLTDASFDYATLDGVDFTGATLERTRFTNLDGVPTVKCDEGMRAAQPADVVEFMMGTESTDSAPDRFSDT